MTGQTPGERLRDAAWNGSLTAAEGRAVATILAAVVVADGLDTDTGPDDAEAVLNTLRAVYRSELARLDQLTEPGARAAARRREQAARWPAIEAEAVEQSPEVVRLDERRAARRDHGETDDGR